MSFRANFITKTPVLKYNPKINNYAETKVSLVEFDFKNSQDLMAIVNSVKNWKTKLFAGQTASNASMMYNNLLSAKKNRIYILTSQGNNFDKLNYKDILGLLQMSKVLSKSGEIEYFEVNPDVKFENTNRVFKHIGQGMIDGLKGLYDKISLSAFYEAIPFYDKQGFELTNPATLAFLWKAKK